LGLPPERTATNANFWTSVCFWRNVYMHSKTDLRFWTCV